MVLTNQTPLRHIGQHETHHLPRRFPGQHFSVIEVIGQDCDAVSNEAITAATSSDRLRMRLSLR
jgi:hypothetical protein